MLFACKLTLHLLLVPFTIKSYTSVSCQVSAPKSSSDCDLTTLYFFHEHRFSYYRLTELAALSDSLSVEWSSSLAEQEVRVATEHKKKNFVGSLLSQLKEFA